MSTILLTGSTGLIGAAIARLLLDQGHDVRGVIRNPESRDALAVAEVGVDVVKGDVTDLDSILRAARGTDAVIHSAAMLGGPTQSLEEGFAVNALGTLNVLTAAARLGISPVVQLSTTTFFDMWQNSLTETSPLDLKALNVDPYSVTKRFAYVEAQGRIAAGQDIRLVIPGGAFGPSPCVERAMTLPSMNVPLVSAIKGEMDQIVAMPIPWVFVDDVAYVAVAALEKGRAGERYIAMGRTEDVGPLSFFCNAACGIAGSQYRVEDVPRERLDDPDVREKFGDSWADLGKTEFPQPWFDNRSTRERLEYTPMTMHEGLEITVKWLRDTGYI
jgi:nucleoside-diphosphate-sugar epimerase